MNKRLYQIKLVRIVVIALVLLMTGTASRGQTVVHKHTITSPPDDPELVNSSSGKVVFKANYEIVLTAGSPESFAAVAGSDFHAYIVPPASYAIPGKQLDASYFVTIDNHLNFVYEEKYTESTLNYRIYNYKRENAALVTLPALNTLPGVNYYSLNLTGLLPAPVQADYRDAFYLLEITGAKGEVHLLRFRYKPYN